MPPHFVEPIGRRAGSAVILFAISTILSACGGGGEDATAVSSSSAQAPAQSPASPAPVQVPEQTPEQTPAQTPVATTPVTGAPAVPPAQTPGDSAGSATGGGIAPVPPATSAAPGGPSVSRAAVVKALATSSDTVAVRQDQSLDLLAFLTRDFSRVSQSVDGSRIRQVSTLTLASDPVTSPMPSSAR
ncbi:MAG: hypothetical protein R3E68_07820 [Burkholderiaceae bacterium]